MGLVIRLEIRSLGGNGLRCGEPSDCTRKVPRHGTRSAACIWFVANAPQGREAFENPFTADPSFVSPLRRIWN
jgi:hypothetical protein